MHNKYFCSNSDNINNPQHVIMRNEDEYLIYPCDQDASFTIELCENIKILRVELANYELFSGTPAHFAVFTSDKFSSDTSDWVTVGNFNIDSEKMKHQVFPIMKAKGFGKFIRIKLDTFHGSEHYCTLTSFKVFGITEYEYVAMKDNEEMTAAPAALDSIDTNMFGVSSSKHQTMFVLYQYLFLHPFQNVCQIDSKEESEDEETQNQRESVLINLATKIKMCEKNSSHLANELNNLKTTLEMNKKEFLKAEKKHKDEMEALTEQIQFLQMMQKNLQESLGAVVGLFLIVIVVSKFFDFCNSRRWYMKKKKKGLEMAASAKPQLSVPQAKRVTFEVNDALENVLKDNMFGRNEQNFQRRVTWCSGSLRKNINRSN